LRELIGCVTEQVQPDDEEVVEASDSDAEDSDHVSDDSNYSTPQPELVPPPEEEPERTRSGSPRASSPGRMPIVGVSPQSRPDLYYHSAIDQPDRIVAPEPLYTTTNHWEMAYECGEEVKIRPGKPMRCRLYGHRVLYKNRTKRVVQFEAWRCDGGQRWRCGIQYNHAIIDLVYKCEIQT
jgi:DNA-directed RNA polymerase subunit RPC12/RpoP